jgi:hypothetical protein
MGNVRVRWTGWVLGLPGCSIASAIRVANEPSRRGGVKKKRLLTTSDTHCRAQINDKRPHSPHNRPNLELDRLTRLVNDPFHTEPTGIPA